MLKALYHKDFKRDFKKLSKKTRERFAERFLIFLKNPIEPILRDHPLIGDLHGKRAFSIAGDIRVVYRFLDKKTVLLLRIGTHNQLYLNSIFYCRGSRRPLQTGKAGFGASPSRELCSL